jgi:hypothetical protein
MKIKRNFGKKQFLSINKILCKICQFGSIYGQSLAMNEFYAIASHFYEGSLLYYD